MVRIKSVRAWILAGGLCVAPAVFAQAPGNDLLERTRRLQEVAAQQREAEARQVLADSLRSASADPTGAILRLKAALANLQGDDALPATKRTALMKQLEDRIRLIESGTTATARKTADTQAAASVSNRQGISRQVESEKVQIRQALDTIGSFQRAGQTEAAEQAAADLAKRFPTNPAAQAMTRSTSLTSRINAARELVEEMDKRFVAVQRDIDRSALPPIGDIEFPKDWKERTAKRGAIDPLSPKEKALLKALNSPIDAKFNGTPFEEAIQYLSDRTGQPILLDKSALNDAQITTDTPVTTRLPKTVSMRTVLRQILSEFGLTYVIKDEAIMVTSQIKARETLSTKAYYIGDLTTGVGMFGGAATWGPFLDQAQTIENVNRMIDTIVNTVDPSSWKNGGGPGSITYHWPTQSLLIRQTAEVHAQLRGSFAR